MGVMSKISTNTVNLEAKTLLAKLLASEDITVRHQSVDTAMFNVETRTLTLPSWEKMDGSLYDMLVGHEVGHALFTPNELKEAIAEVDPAGDCSEATTFDYLNVVEDARIERLMQDKFPGLRRDFVRSYNDLFSRGFFGEVDEEDLENRRLIDRVNLHYKVGRLLQIDFNAREQAVIDMIDRADTWEEVVEATRVLFILGREEAEKRAEENEAEEEFSDQGMPAPLCGEGDEESDSEGMGANADDESGEGDGAGDGDGDGDDESDTTARGGEGENGEDDSQQDGSPSTAGAGNPKVDAEMKAETVRDFEDSLNKLIKDDRKPRNFTHISIPDTISSHFVVSVPEFIEECVKSGGMISWDDTRWQRLNAQLSNFEQSTKKIVSGMVQRFEMMKAAHEHKRTMTSDTGMIDMSKLSGYKWDDNIFLKSEEVADGKNHGMIMYVDWSGSMAQITNDTMKQVLILAMFCKKVNIPFACYAFIGGFNHYQAYTPEQVSERIRNAKHGDAVLGDLRLVEIATSEHDKMTTRKGMAFWLGVAAAEDNSNDPSVSVRYSVPAFRQCGTPLDDAIAVGVNIANEFRVANNIEVLNTVFLTDGQSSSGPLDWHGEVWDEELNASTTPKSENDAKLATERVLYSKKNGKTYRAENRYSTSTSVMMEYYKEHTQSNVTCIQICPRNRRDIGYWVGMFMADPDAACYLNPDGRNDVVEKVMKSGADVLSNVNGFEQFIFMSSENSRKVKGLDDVKKGSNTRVLANAFIREKQNRKRITQVMDQFVDHISKEYV
jgi:hypothetical protein